MDPMHFARPFGPSHPSPASPPSLERLVPKLKCTRDSACSIMDGIKDDLKWFGQGFDGFPKSLPEDCVEYTLSIIDATLDDSDLRTRLRVVQSAAKALAKRLLRDFIWQRESFGLDLVHQDGKVIYRNPVALDRADVADPGMSCLRGRTNYGDSVGDEWLVVYILRELSKQHPDVWIKTVDTDGEFLLIEAANALPRWLNPEIADNRVSSSNGTQV